LGFGIAADLDGENAGHDDHHSQPVLEGQESANIRVVKDYFLNADMKVL
jgi:hypothetical protein|tara:strand:+ start:90 stop:236 length:147 start_codon:yes stop_codon:yes gene_type:complete